MCLSLDELRREYDRKANRSEDEIREEARRAVKSAGGYDARLDRAGGEGGGADGAGQAEKLDRLSSRRRRRRRWRKRPRNFAG